MSKNKRTETETFQATFTVVVKADDKTDTLAAAEELFGQLLEVGESLAEVWRGNPLCADVFVGLGEADVLQPDSDTLSPAWDDDENTLWENVTAALPVDV